MVRIAATAVAVAARAIFGIADNEPPQKLTVVAVAGHTMVRAEKLAIAAVTVGALEAIGVAVYDDLARRTCRDCRHHGFLDLHDRCHIAILCHDHSSAFSRRPGHGCHRRSRPVSPDSSRSRPSLSASRPACNLLTSI